MKYIYDLKELDKLGPAHLPAAQFAALIAIAERLEGLAEAQKPRWVELTMVDGKKITIPISPFFPIAVSEHNGIEGVENTVLLQTHADNHLIDGTLAEVLAKLRGEVTK